MEKGIGSLIRDKDAKKIGAQLASLHSRPLTLDLRCATLLNGQYLNTKSRALMPFHEEIEKALVKMDCILEQVTSNLPKPYVNLWNQQEEGKNPDRLFYGNPSWDLGIVTNTLGEGVQIEAFLRKYLSENGVFITVIELYTGILYAKLSEAIDNRCKKGWERLAQNECANVLRGAGLMFKEIPAGVLARLGLPGLMRAGQ